MKRTVLILSGPTHEYFDPVRFIGNASSGLMGKALAEEAVKRGFRVEFVSGPVASANLPELGTEGTMHAVVSAQEMLDASSMLIPSAAAVLFAAAVADYAPREKSEEKKAKSEDGLTLQLSPTPDVAKTLCAEKKHGQIAIGFALQTSNGEDHARRKLREKRLDGIVLNTPATLGAVKGTFSFLDAETDQFDTWGHISKGECASRILDAVERMLPG